MIRIDKYGHGKILKHNLEIFSLKIELLGVVHLLRNANSWRESEICYAHYKENFISIQILLQGGV